MLKKIGKIVSKIVISALFIYAVNMAVVPMNVNVPINFYTVGIITVLGIPSLIFMFVMMKFIF